MIPRRTEAYDDLIDEELCAYQSQLDQGVVGAKPSSPATGMPETRQLELDELRRCLDLLHHFRCSTETSRTTNGTTPVPGSYHVPERIGRFSIRRQLGAGGCGIVFLGVDPEIGRQVAIKIPRPDLLSSPEAINRFLQEARAASQLEHPNILPVYESQSDGIVPYLVMPYIAGGSLAKWLAAHPRVPSRQAAEIVRQLAEGLSHSHDRGVLHRDVKPGNVLLASPDSANLAGELPFVPKLTDFGLAKCADFDRPETRTGALLGTMCYMAPEQAEGRRDVTAQTDVYGLGAVLYELLAGSPPFRGGSDLETLERVRREEPPSLRSKRSDVPSDLDVICLKCLEKNPRNRYPSARASG